MFVSNSFYKGEKKTEEEILTLFEVYHNFNVVGKQIIALALKVEVITAKNILTIGGVPHAQFIIL